MKVWLFTISQRLEDAEQTRTFLLGNKLIERGHLVTLWTSAFDHHKKRFRGRHGQIILYKKNFKIILLKGVGYKRNVSIARFIDHFILSKRFQPLAQDMPKPDVLVVSLPDYHLAYEATKYARLLGIPVVVDVRDAWPDVFVDAFRTSLLRTLIRPFILLQRKKVARVIKRADSVVSMMNVLLEWALRIAGRPRTNLDKVFYLCSAYPVSQKLREKEGVSYRVVEAVQSCARKVIYLFIGSFGLYYNPKIIIEAVRLLNQQGGMNITNDMCFIIGGYGDYFNEIVRLSKGLQGVHLTGWLNSRDMHYLLLNSDVGIIPATTRIYAFPNKAFTYLSAGLPIISSVEGDLAEFIDKYKFGVNFRAGRSDELAARICYLQSEPNIRRLMKDAAKSFFSSYLDPGKTYDMFVAHIEEVAKNDR